MSITLEIGTLRVVSGCGSLSYTYCGTLHLCQALTLEEGGSTIVCMCFVQAFNQPTFLEDLTGLTAMLRATDDLLAVWEEGDENVEDIDDF
jgi:hypothetical protein